MKTIISFGLLAALTLVAGTAGATPGTVGYSGKPDATNPDGAICSDCHTSTTAHKPGITLTVPSTMTAGQTAQFSIKITGTQGGISFNAALPDGVEVTAGGNTEVPFPQTADIVPKSPPDTSTNITYTFQVKAPPENGTMKLWVAAMDVKVDGNKGDDGVSSTTKDITITGGTTGGTKDGGTTSPKTDAGTGTSAGDRDASSSSSTGDGADPAADEDSPPHRSSSGCSSAAHTGPMGAGGFGAALGLAMLLLRRRRRRMV